MRLLHWFHTLPLRLRSLLRRGQVDRDLDEELVYHITRRTEQYIGEGLQPREAYEAALREWRGVEQIKEECRDMRRINFIQDLQAISATACGKWPQAKDSPWSWLHR